MVTKVNYGPKKKKTRSLYLHFGSPSRLYSSIPTAHQPSATILAIITLLISWNGALKLKNNFNQSLRGLPGHKSTNATLQFTPRLRPIIEQIRTITTAISFNRVIYSSIHMYKHLFFRPIRLSTNRTFIHI